MVVRQELPQLPAGARPIPFLFGDLRQEGAWTCVARGLRRELGGPFERRLRPGRVARLHQRLAELQLADEVAGGRRRTDLERRDVVGTRRGRRRIRHRAAERAVPLVDERLEGRVDGIDTAAERLGERHSVRGAVGIGEQQRPESLVAVDFDQVLHDQRRLEIRQRQALGPLEGVRQALHAKRLPECELMRVLERQLAAPGRLAAVLLENRDAFRQPARHPELRELQRVDVGELVPEGGLPAELPGLSRPGRIHRDDAAEARAESAHQAGQPERAHGKVVVQRKHLDQDRSARREAVARRERLVRLGSQRHSVRLEYGGFFLRELEDEVAGLHDLERVDPVEDVEQVLGERSALVEIPRALERAARGFLVARPHEVQAEVEVRLRVVCIEGGGLSRQLGRFVEPVAPRRLLTGRAIAERRPRVDFAHACDGGLDRCGPALFVCERNPQCGFFDGSRPHRGEAIERLSGGGKILGLERALGGQPQNAGMIGRQLARGLERRFGRFRTAVCHLVQCA